MRNLLIIPLIVISFLLSACGSTVPKMKPFKMDIQQGNVVNSKMLLQLRPGMTKSQVKFIMGTPLITDSFHGNRWDYFYQMRQSGKVKEQRRVILDFEKELLVRVRGDVVPQGTAGAEPAQDGNTLASAKSVNPTPFKQAGIMEKLKFWKSDEKQASNGIKAKKEKDLFDTFKFWEKDEAEEAKEAAAVVAPTKAVEAAGDLTAEATPSLLAVPISGVPPLETPKVEAPAIDAPTEKPIVAVAPEPAAPETIVSEAKVAETVAELPKVETPKVETPKVETPKQEKLAPEVVAPVIAAPIVAAPAKEAIAESAPSSEPVNAVVKDEPFIFRMDKNLNLKNLENSPANAVNIKDKLKKADTPPPAPAEEPGYFERILEKIGF